MKLRTGLVLAVILVLGATGYFLVRSAEDRVTADMLSRVERFAIPSDWQLDVETVWPERFLCISTNPCPSFYRRWNAGKELTAAEVDPGGRCATGLSYLAPFGCEDRAL
ncbi:hypothetical protein M1E17_04020 [Arthrobacter sp. D1-29]